MTNKINEIDGETGTTILRDMNDSELAQLEIDVAEEVAREALKAEKETAKAELLARLGITAEEAKLLFA